MANTDSWIVGRGKSCDIVLNYPTVSRSHARLAEAAEGIDIRDLGSTNGTHEIREPFSSSSFHA